MFDQVGLPMITEYTSQEWQWIYQWWGRGRGKPLSLYLATLSDAVGKRSFRNRPWADQSTSVEGTYLMAAWSFSHRTVSTETRSSQRDSTVDPSNRGGDRHQTSVAEQYSLPQHSFPSSAFDTFRTEKVIFRCWAFLRPPKVSERRIKCHHSSRHSKDNPGRKYETINYKQGSFTLNEKRFG